MRLSDLVFQNETKTLEFDGFGKSAIVAHSISPDAFVQLGFMGIRPQRLNPPDPLPRAAAAIAPTVPRTYTGITCTD